MAIDRKELTLYAITDRAWTGKRTLEEQIALAIEGGATIVQLREKGIPDEIYEARARSAKAACAPYGVKLIIDDNVQVALRSGADGVHVGIEDMPVDEIRSAVVQYWLERGKLLSVAMERAKKFIIGATAKTVEQAREAQSAGADYLGVGAVFPSPTKTNAIRITKEMLAEITSSVTIPVVAIGGITAENMREIAHSGISGVAVVSAIFASDDVYNAAKLLRRTAEEIIK